jgi:hypothetical protein
MNQLHNNGWSFFHILNALHLNCRVEWHLPVSDKLL